MVEFMRELKAKLSPAGLMVTQAVPADDDSYDLKGLAAIDDYIVPMVYDEHYQSGTPGPVASITGSTTSWRSSRRNCRQRRPSSDSATTVTTG